MRIVVDRSGLPAVDPMSDGSWRASADSEAVIRGFVVNDETGHWLQFTARRTVGHLVGSISNALGKTLFEYGESEEVPVYSGDSSVPSWERVPRLSILGASYSIDNELAWQMMGSIATSEDGMLIRHLALNLSFAVPEADFVDLRRALQVPFQAMQSLYPARVGEDAGGAVREVASADTKGVGALEEGQVPDAQDGTGLFARLAPRSVSNGDPDKLDLAEVRSVSSVSEEVLNTLEVVGLPGGCQSTPPRLSIFVKC